MSRCTPAITNCFCNTYRASLIEEYDKVTGVTTLHYPTSLSMVYTGSSSIASTEGWVYDTTHQFYYKSSISDWRLIFGAFGTFEFYSFVNGTDGCDGVQLINYEYSDTAYAVITLECDSA